MMKLNLETALTEAAESNNVEVAGADAVSAMTVMLAFLMYGWMYRRGPMVEVGRVSSKHAALFKDFYNYSKSLSLNKPALGAVKRLASTMSLLDLTKRLKNEGSAASYLRSAASSNPSIITVTNALDDSAWGDKSVGEPIIKILKRNGVDNEFIKFAREMVKLGTNR